MSSTKGFILLDLIISLMVFCLIAQLLQAGVFSKHGFSYDVEDGEMRQLWQDEDYLKIWDPAKRIKPVEGDDPSLPPIEEDLP